MPYDPQRDEYRERSLESRRLSFGRTGSTITPSDTVDLPSYGKAIVVTVAGNLVILPSKNADGQTIPFTGVPVGFIPPYQVRRVMATGTTASVATVAD